MDHMTDAQSIWWHQSKWKATSPIDFVCQRYYAKFQDQSMSITRETN